MSHKSLFLQLCVARLFIPTSLRSYIDLCRTTLCSYSCMFSQLMFQQAFVPTAVCSHNLCSNKPLFPQLYVLTTYVPTSLCSHNCMFSQLMFQPAFVPTCTAVYVYPALLSSNFVCSTNSLFHSPKCSTNPLFHNAIIKQLFVLTTACSQNIP